MALVLMRLCPVSLRVTTKERQLSTWKAETTHFEIQADTEEAAARIVASEMHRTGFVLYVARDEDSLSDLTHGHAFGPDFKPDTMTGPGPWVTRELLREVAIRLERAEDPEAVADDVKDETVQRVQAWWERVAIDDWDRFGEKFVDILTSALVADHG